MLHSNRSAVLISLAVLLTSLTACSNSQIAKNLEQSLAADSRLKDNPVIFGANQTGDRQNQQNNSAPQLPADFPKEIPLYPNAQLQEVIPSSDTESQVSTRWLSSDPTNFIASYYRNQFQTNNWQILQQPTDEQGGSFEARHNDLQVKVAIAPKSVTNAAPNQPQTATELIIEYQPNTTTTAQAGQSTNNIVPQPSDSQFVGPVQPNNNSVSQPVSTPNTTNNTIGASGTSPQEFSDLNKVPQELRTYIQDLAALGVLSVESNATKSNSNNTTNQFEPNRTITHRGLSLIHI